LGKKAAQPVSDPATPAMGSEERVLRTAFHLQAFEDALTLEEGASPRTVDAYRRDVIRCAVFMREQGIPDAALITPAALREFIY